MVSRFRGVLEFRHPVAIARVVSRTKCWAIALKSLLPLNHEGDMAKQYSDNEMSLGAFRIPPVTATLKINVFDCCVNGTLHDCLRCAGISMSILPHETKMDLLGVGQCSTGGY